MRRKYVSPSAARKFKLDMIGLAIIAVCSISILSLCLTSLYVQAKCKGMTSFEQCFGK